MALGYDGSMAVGATTSNNASVKQQSQTSSGSAKTNSKKSLVDVMADAGQAFYKTVGKALSNPAVSKAAGIALANASPTMPAVNNLLTNYGLTPTLAAGAGYVTPLNSGSGSSAASPAAGGSGSGSGSGSSGSAAAAAGKVGTLNSGGFTGMLADAEKKINDTAMANNEWSAQQAQLQRDWQEYMSNTAHQREVADLQAAGLNPVLSAGGNGASTPSGAMGDTDTSNTRLIGDLAEMAISGLSQTAAGYARAKEKQEEANTLLGKAYQKVQKWYSSHPLNKKIIDTGFNTLSGVTRMAAFRR